MMTKGKGNEVPEQKDNKERKPVIVYRGVSMAQKEHIYSFTLTPEQAEFIKAHKKEINFSETLRVYMDSVMTEYNTKQ